MLTKIRSSPWLPGFSKKNSAKLVFPFWEIEIDKFAHTRLDAFPVVCLRFEDYDAAGGNVGNGQGSQNV